MGDYKNYDSNAVDLVICAVPITDGRAENFVKITATEDAFGTEVSADGEVTRFATHNDVADVEVTLKRSSKHNQQLAAIFAADRLSTAGAGVGVLLVKDRNGASVFASDKCWIKKLPDWQSGKAVGDVTWQLQCVIKPLGAIPGGN
ncbi:MAG: DUF3277 family protein [Candidatus Omnitrophica bacterium]|jgi:hypothetical protein|nr:DUF3277 family protein [Candidatus Omnitrophota bacterium]